MNDHKCASMKIHGCMCIMVVSYVQDVLFAIDIKALRSVCVPNDAGELYIHRTKLNFVLRLTRFEILVSEHADSRADPVFCNGFATLCNFNLEVLAVNF